METGARADEPRRGPPFLNAGKIAQIDPYRSILKVMKQRQSKGQTTSRKLLLESNIKGRAMRNGTYPSLSKSGLTKALNRLMAMGLIAKIKATNEYEIVGPEIAQLKRTIDVRSRVDSTDSHDYGNGVVVWGTVLNTHMRDMEIKRLKAIGSQIKKIQIVSIVNRIKEDVAVVVNDDRASPRFLQLAKHNTPLTPIQKAYFLLEMSSRIGYQAEQLGWNPNIRKKFRIQRLVGDLTTEKGLPLITNGNLRKSVGALLEKKRERNIRLRPETRDRIQGIVDVIMRPMMPPYTILLTLNIELSIE